MKKLIFILGIFVAFTACKKENINTESLENTTSDSVTIAEPANSSSAVTPFKRVELSPDETSKFLAKKNDDTLYVTNFFATWCGPCMVEIPHFKEKMEELKSQPVKFTFVSLDSKNDWDTKVKNFAEEENLSNDVVLLDGTQLNAEFFPANFKQWDGNAIPFTFMRKGDKTDETLGSMSKEMLTEKLNSFK